MRMRMDFTLPNVGFRLFCSCIFAVRRRGICKRGRGRYFFRILSLAGRLFNRFWIAGRSFKGFGYERTHPVDDDA